MQLNVIIRNTTPVFSAAPGAVKVDIHGKVKPEGFPLTRARTLTVAAVMGDGVVRPVPLPVVPGNTMRNMLRRAMLKHLIEPAVRERGQLTIGAYAATYSGNASGNPDGVPNSFDEIVALRAHPFIGLFGGGPRMLEGRLMVDSLYPLHVHAQRVIGDGYEERLVSGDITDIVWTRRIDPITRIKTAEQASLIEKGPDAVAGWIQDLWAKSEGAAAKRKKKGAEVESEDSDEKSARGLQAMNAHEVVIPGIDWLWRINADNPTEAQIGLILSALAHLPEENLAGGHAKDYGRFTIENITLGGQSIWNAGAYHSDLVSSYMDALAEELDEIKPADFERFAASRKEAS